VKRNFEDKWHKFLLAGHPFCHQINSAKALKLTQNRPQPVASPHPYLTTIRHLMVAGTLFPVPPVSTLAFELTFNPDF